MKNQAPLFASMSIIFLLGAAGNAATQEEAESWQKQSLKGISSLRYGAAYDPSGSLSEICAEALKDLKIKSIPIKDMKADRTNPLSDSEGRLVLVKDAREKEQFWVGISLQQKCRMARNQSITVDGETYKLGKLCSEADSKDQIKKFCSIFAADFKSQNKK